MSVKKAILSFLFLSITYPFLAAVKGSESAVSVEPAYTFAAADNDNTMLGFGWFKNGFTLEDSLTTCTFDSVYPVSGGIDLNGGNLYLTQDLFFNNTTTLQGFGTIIAGGHTIDFCTSVTAFPSDTKEFDSANIIFHGALHMVSAVTFKGNCLLWGLSNEFELGANAEIIIDSGSTLEIRDLELEGIQGNNVRCVDDTASIILHNVKWVQNDDFTFSNGSISFHDQVDMVGTCTFIYESSQTSTIKAYSLLHISEGMNLKIGKDVATGNEPLAFTDKTSKLEFDNAGFFVPSTGITLTKGTLVFDRDVTIDIDSTSTSNGIIIGNGQASDDTTIYLSSGAVVRLLDGHFTYNNATSDKIKSASQTARLARAVDSNVYVAQDLTLPSMTVELESNLVPPMQVESGKTLAYDKSVIILPDIEFNITSKQSSAYTYLLDGNHSLFFTKGSLLLSLLIQNTGNVVRGNAGITGTLTLQDSSAELSLGITGDMSGALTLNSGKITLSHDLILINNNVPIGPGIIDLASSDLILTGSSPTSSTNLYFDGTSGAVLFNGQLSLSSTWTIGGNCTIDGNGSSLVLGDNGQLIVDTDANLTLKNMNIIGVGGNNIRCIDDSSCITCFNTNLVLDSNYTFSFGCMNFKRKNSVSGPYTFAYESSQTSTVNTDSRLSFKDGTTFFVGRKDDTTSVEPLYFGNDTSILEFDNSKFSVKSTGMNLTRGTVWATRDIEIDVNSTSTADGLTFGDGTAAGDMKIQLNPACSARFIGGHITYDATTSDAIKSKSNTAYLSRSNTSVFYLKNNVTLADTSVEVALLASLIIDAGKVLDYSNGRVTVSNIGTFDLTGTRYSDTTTLLGGSDKITLLSGSLPLATLVQSTGNTIEGAGNITGPIILQDSNAELTCNLTGYLLANVSMNGGKIILGSDFDFGNDILLAGSGTVDLNGNNIDLGKSDLVWTGSAYWDASNGGGTVNLHAQVSLSGTWTFNGSNCELHGHGNLLDLGSTGEVVVNSNTTLVLQDLGLENFSNDNVRCVDDTGKIVLDNVNWCQKGSDYNFDTGAIQFKNKVKMHGKTVFAYQSSQTSTILANASLKLDSGFTFSYDPNSTSQDLIAFIDETSKLILNSATLHTTGTGMNLTKGNLVVQGESQLVSEKDDTTDEGITFGDGTASGDLTVKIDSGSKLTVSQGSLNYKNTSDKWTMLNDLSVLVMSANTTLRLYESLTINNGLVRFGDNTALKRASNKDLVGDIDVTADLTFASL